MLQKWLKRLRIRAANYGLPQLFNGRSSRQWRKFRFLLFTWLACFAFATLILSSLGPVRTYDAKRILDLSLLLDDDGDTIKFPPEFLFEPDDGVPEITLA
eukprot:Selendium_serpulae@DN4971_c0_g2_i1.p1